MHNIIDEITESNRWRDSEFAKFKSNSDRVDSNLWFRMCIPMIYAHWEGFVVDSLKTLLRHLNYLSIPHAHLKTNLIVIALDKNYQSLSGKQSFEQRILFTDKFTDILQSKVNFSLKIDTKSNLKSSVFNDICYSFGFDYNKYKSQMPDIDRLVNVRNSIAHGENSFVVSQENIEKYISAVNAACDQLLIDIDDFLHNEKFRCSKNQ